jgi:hypothetical protein
MSLAKRDEFIAKAESYLGYSTVRPFESVFGERLGFQGMPWDGAFIDVCLFECGLESTSFFSTTVALADYIKRGRFHVRPRKGDIVYFETSNSGDFHQPHIGIVTATNKWDKDGLVETVEGMVSSGLARKGDGNDGVYRRTRSRYEILGFVRLDFDNLKKGVDSSIPVINVGQLRMPTPHPSVGLVQQALDKTVGLRRVKTGIFDGKTRTAYAQFQRQVGLPQSLCDGIPENRSLLRLGQVTGLFRLDG